MAQPESNERKWILLLCLLAAVHVFIFSAAFPFFNNVDEPMHFDLAVKYSQWRIPSGLESFSDESLPYLVIYATGEYARSQQDFIGDHFPTPHWKQSFEMNRQQIAGWTAFWHKTVNYEISQPPLYYAMAGLWWNFGKDLGFKDGWLLYWLRFLDIFAVVSVVWLGHLAARIIFPENIFLRLGVPAVVAFMPQTAFYSIDNDVLSPLCFGAAFICLVKFLRSEIPPKRLGALTGLAFAAVLLVKMTNLPLVAVAFAAVFFKTWRMAKAENFRAALPALSWLVVCAGLPMIGWMVWCKCHFGDFTGSKIKTEYLTWTLKPFAEWWQHQIFKPGGMWAYLSGQLGTFWQGEFAWHGQHLATSSSNAVFTALSLALPSVALIRLFQPFSDATQTQRELLCMAFAGCVATLMFFAFFSIIYDFHGCPNPSRERPYFHSGRLLLGALVPFLLLFVYGIDSALNRFGNRVKFSVLAAMILSMLIFEIATDWPVFSSQYNWFHM